MANQIVFLYKDDRAAAERIVRAFAEETGLTPEAQDGTVAFAVHGREHEIKVVETLNRIDEEWNRHLRLGDPQADSS